MKMVKMFGGVLIVTTLGYADGDFQVLRNYKSNDGILAKKAYVDSYIDEPVAIIDKKDDDAYVAPMIEAYMDSNLIEKEPKYINSSHVEDVVNVNNASRNGFYSGLGITALNYDISCDCPDKSATDMAVGAITKVGYNLNRFIGIEARGMKVNLTNDMGSIKHVGLFLKPMLPLGPVANAYGLVGVAQTKSSGKVRKVNITNAALGAGMEFGSGKGVGVFVDYEKLVVKSGSPSLDTVSTGLSFGF